MLGVERSRTAIHNWVRKTDVQPSSDREPDHIAVDETVIQLNNQRHWLYAAVDPETNDFSRQAVSDAARWWYLHGKGGSDPAFRWAIEWARHLATDTPSDVKRFDEFLEYLVTVGFADENHELR